jgi:predicted HAD superfamily Cof-like phosphohydrolase
MSAGKGLNQVFKAVKQFHRFCKHPIGNIKDSHKMEHSRYTLFYASQVQHVCDTISASANSDVGQPYYQNIQTLPRQTRLDLRLSWILEEIVELLEAKTLVSQIDALLDIIYLAVGTLVEIGFYPGKSFDAVHHANMQKLPSQSGEKVIKPPGWVSPESEIDKELFRQHGLNVIPEK